MREVDLSLNGTLREIFSFGESRGAFDRFLPSMCVMAEAQRYRPFGHRLSDELSEIILDYLHSDHHLTTTVQAAPQNVGKACCDNQQRAFSCFGGKCAEPTKFTFHRQSIPPCRSSPTRKARGSNPPGRTKSSTLWGAALFVLHGFYGAAKGRIRTARAPRFASRGAETPRWGVSRARLGESLRAHQNAHCNVLLQCVFLFRVSFVF